MSRTWLSSRNEQSEASAASNGACCLSILSLLLTILFAVIIEMPIAQAKTESNEVSCACEEFACKPCEVQTDLTFYTAKCGPANSRVKSCKKPTCEPEPNYKQCLTDLKSKTDREASAAGKTPAVTTTTGAGGNVQSLPGAGVAGGDPSADGKSAMASSGPSVGSVTDLLGSAKFQRASGGEENARVGLSVYEGDVIETSEKSKVRVSLIDGNVLTVAPASHVTIDVQQSDRKTGRKKTLLNLMYGKIRTKVNKTNNYDGSRNLFQVRTKSSVAGVRGTDFVTSFRVEEKSWVTEINTFEGLVEFGGDGLSDTVQIRERQSASFRIQSPPEEVTDLQLRSYIKKGELLSPRAMTEPEIKAIDEETDFRDPRSTKEKGSASNPSTADGRRPASVADEAICTQPNGSLGQCSFVFEKNQNGTGVVCVRRLCNAGGRWADRTVLSPRSYGFCDSKQPIVRDCGDY